MRQALRGQPHRRNRMGQQRCGSTCSNPCGNTCGNSAAATTSRKPPKTCPPCPCLQAVTRRGGGRQSRGRARSTSSSAGLAKSWATRLPSLHSLPLPIPRMPRTRRMPSRALVPRTIAQPNSRGATPSSRVCSRPAMCPHVCVPASRPLSFSLSRSPLPCPAPFLPPLPGVACAQSRGRLRAASVRRRRQTEKQS